MKGRLYIDGKFLFDLEPLVYPKLTILSHEITDYLVYVHSYKGDYYARLNGTVWRVCKLLLYEDIPIERCSGGFRS